MERATVYTLAREMSEVNGRSVTENVQYIRLLLEVIKDSLKNGRRVFLPHFGTLKLKRYPSRQVYIPPKKAYGTSKEKVRLVVSTSADFSK